MACSGFTEAQAYNVQHVKEAPAKEDAVTCCMHNVSVRAEVEIMQVRTAIWMILSHRAVQVHVSSYCH